jgi:DNA-binding HxlR family transcriptional regulator
MGGMRDSGECGAIDAGITRVFTLLGKRWSGVLIAVLMSQGRSFFTELRRSTPGISERMLSDRLSELSSAGLVRREVEEGPPLRVSYQLTPAGHALTPAMNELAEWAAKWMPETGPCPSVPRESTPCDAAVSQGERGAQAAHWAREPEREAVAE